VRRGSRSGQVLKGWIWWNTTNIAKKISANKSDRRRTKVTCWGGCRSLPEEVNTTARCISIPIR
jgi:hypothetical protein